MIAKSIRKTNIVKKIHPCGSFGYPDPRKNSKSVFKPIYGFGSFFVLLVFFILLVSPANSYTYQDVLDYAASPACQEYYSGTMLCCDPARRLESSSYYSQCYPTLECSCVIEDRTDGGYDVKRKRNYYDSNWQDRKIAVATAASAHTLCNGTCTATWKKANCDGSVTLDTLIGVGNYYCTSTQYGTAYNYGRKCDTLWHQIGAGDCNGGCPSRINDITTISYPSTPKVYRESDGKGCNLSEWAVTPSGNCNTQYGYFLLQSFVGPPEFNHIWGVGNQNDLRQTGAFKKSKGRRNKGIGGYELKNN